MEVFHIQKIVQKYSQYHGMEFDGIWIEDYHTVIIWNRKIKYQMEPMPWHLVIPWIRVDFHVQAVCKRRSRNELFLMAAVCWLVIIFPRVLFSVTSPKLHGHFPCTAIPRKIEECFRDGIDPDRFMYIYIFIHINTLTWNKYKIVCSVLFLRSFPKKMFPPDLPAAGSLDNRELYSYPRACPWWGEASEIRKNKKGMHNFP